MYDFLGNFNGGDGRMVYAGSPQVHAIRPNLQVNKTSLSVAFAARMRFRQREQHLATQLSSVANDRHTTISVAGTMTEKRAAAKTRGVSDKGDLNYAIGLNRCLLSLIGVWPLNRNPSTAAKNWRTIRLVITSAIILVYAIPRYMYILSNPGMQAYLEDIAPHVFAVLTLIKFVILTLYSGEIGYCVSDIRNNWENVSSVEDREIMLRHGRIGRYMTICCFAFTYSGVLFYSVVLPFLKNPTVKMTGNTSIIERPIPFAISYIYFDGNSTPVYEITWVIQFVGMTYMCLLNCGGYALIGALVAHACGQLRIVGSRMENLVDEDSEEIDDVQERIAETIQHHLRVIRYIAMVNQSFQMIFYTEEFGTLTIVCFVGYLLLSNFNGDNSVLTTTVFLILMTGFTFNFFIISIVGQQLWDESEALSVAVYRVRWHRLSPKIARSLVICMARAARPLKLSAYKMFDMSLSNFGDVIRGAFVFLNMVRQLTEVD